MGMLQDPPASEEKQKVEDVKGDNDLKTIDETSEEALIEAS